MRKSLSIFALLAATTLAGCVTPLPPSRDFDSASRTVSGRDAIVAVAQSEVNVQVNPSNAAVYTGGGLLGALIQVGVDGYRANSAEGSVKPIRAALVDYDFDKAAMSKMQEAFSKVNWMDVKNTTFTKEQTNENYSKILDASNADQVVYNNIEYKFSYDFTTLDIDMLSAAFSKGTAVGDSAQERMSLKNALYYHRFKYVAHLPSPAKDKDANAAQWADNQGALARTALDTGLAKIADDLVTDLQGGVQASASATTSGTR